MIEKREGLKEDRRKREGRAEFPRHRRPHRQRRRPPTHTVPSLNLPLLASNPSMASKELPAMRLPSLPLAPPAPPRHGNRESEPWGGRGVCGGGGSFLGLIGFSPLPGCPKQVRASPFLPSYFDSSPYQREEREVEGRRRNKMNGGGKKSRKQNKRRRAKHR